MAGTIKRKTPKKAARSKKAGLSAITVKGPTKRKGIKSFTFTPVTPSAIKLLRNKAYRYFTID